MTPAWSGRLRWAAQAGVTPEAFWRLSLAEWRALSGGEPSPVLGRRELEVLMAGHPDDVRRPTGGILNE